MTCPFCRSQRYRPIYPAYEGACVTSDLRIVPNARIDNRLCGDCGFVWNDGGPRGRSEEFYRDTYRLRLHAQDSRYVNFSAQGVSPFAGALVEMLADKADLPSGELLEAGAGKGDFLQIFSELKPGWKLTAFEPSAAYDVLRQRVPSAEILRGEYSTIGIDRQFDLVAALGVLEHVEDPVDFVRWLAARLRPRGTLLLTFPDFAINPNDLFCIDHLSKMSAAHLAMIAAQAGLSVLSTNRNGIALCALLGHARDTAIQTNVVAVATDIVTANERMAKDMVDAVACAREAARRERTRFGIFGLGMSGLAAPILIDFPREEIAAYIDENPTMRGVRIGSVPVLGLDGIESLDIRHIALAVSPVYREMVVMKLRRPGLSVYV